MKYLGYLLITGSFLVGAFLAVSQREGVPLAGFLGALAVGVVGVTLARLATHQAANKEETLLADLGAVESSLEAIVERVEALDREKDSTDVYELRHQIDREFPDHLDAFVQARESIARSLGLQPYANVMNPFSAGERYLNRVWSASTDGYIDEAHTYIGLAREQFNEALTIFRSSKHG